MAVGSSLLLFAIFHRPLAEADRVLVLINRNSPDSVEIGSYYVRRRHIPPANIVFLKIGTENNIRMSDYLSGIVAPVRQRLLATKNSIDFIVTTKGVPIRLDSDGGYSVDGYLATMNLRIAPIRESVAGLSSVEQSKEIQKAQNPYFNKRESFRHAKFNMYLVTRLDGYTAADAKALVDRALAARAESGPFLFDMAGNRSSGDYGAMNHMLEVASQILTHLNFRTILDSSADFLAPKEPLAGYASWGSNDGAYRREIYNRLRFKPGALSETFVSTSAFTFSARKHWQSLIADLIEQGVTGVKGYVSEPYTFALARPHILFERYVAGYNLAESFYMASPVIRWKDVVIGDPLCRPYPRN